MTPAESWQRVDQEWVDLLAQRNEALDVLQFITDDYVETLKADGWDGESDPAVMVARQTILKMRGVPALATVDPREPSGAEQE